MADGAADTKGTAGAADAESDLVRMGAAEYERKAILLEGQRRYGEALAICRQALASATLGEREETQFRQRVLRLERKRGLGAQRPLPAIP